MTNTDLSTVKVKRVAEVVGVCPVEEVFNAPIPKEVLESFLTGKGQGCHVAEEN